MCVTRLPLSILSNLLSIIPTRSCTSYTSTLLPDTQVFKVMGPEDKVGSILDKRYVYDKSKIADWKSAVMAKMNLSRSYVKSDLCPPSNRRNYPNDGSILAEARELSLTLVLKGGIPTWLDRDESNTANAEHSSGRAA